MVNTDDIKAMKTNFEIIATISTTRFDNIDILKFIENGVTIFRLNGAFLDLDKISRIINQLRRIIGPSVKILVDLPGYKIRFLYLEEDIKFKREKPLCLKREFFNYPRFFEVVKKGSVIRINNGFHELKVMEKSLDHLICKPNADGVITKGRGLHLSDIAYRPASTCLPSFDMELITTLKKCDVDYVGLSFVHDMKDVLYVEEMLKPSKIRCIPKIESKESINNISEILKNSEMFILDRGDLAGEIGIELIWETQKKILSLSKFFNTRAILATQVLASMLKNPIPSIPEVESLYELLNMGISGIQLSEETSVGRHSHKCISFLNKAVKSFEERAKI